MQTIIGWDHPELLFIFGQGPLTGSLIVIVRSGMFHVIVVEGIPFPFHLVAEAIMQNKTSLVYAFKALI